MPHQPTSLITVAASLQRRGAFFWYTFHAQHGCQCGSICLFIGLENQGVDVHAIHWEIRTSTFTAPLATNSRYLWSGSPGNQKKICQ